ncbi:unnamed protein product [Mytilus coruscus]|uniref:Uncharacterized protein n=1 Tax=Mytilus coruscus TaxID=42192 RepID=A0A6J8F151_MYTCO|nr:unnamed protein product [Mytilus coruscus]
MLRSLNAEENVEFINHMDTFMLMNGKIANNLLNPVDGVHLTDDGTKTLINNFHAVVPILVPIKRNAASSKIRSSKRAFFENAIKTDRNCKQIWKHLKDLNHSGKNSITSLKTGNDYIRNLTDIVQHLNDHFSSIRYKLVPKPKTTFSLDCLASFVKSRINGNHSFSLYSVSISEVYNELIKLDVSTFKATWLDEVGPRILKLSSPITSEPLAHIINLT